MKSGEEARKRREKLLMHAQSLHAEAAPSHQYLQHGVKRFHSRGVYVGWLQLLISSIGVVLP